MHSRHRRTESGFPHTGDTAYRVGNSLFLHCSKCKVRRPIFGAARARYDAIPPAGQQELADSGFTCSWVGDASFENACGVPAVSAQGYDWWYETKQGKDLFVELGGEVVDQTRLFFFVQACASELRECEEAVIKKTCRFARNPVSNIWLAIARKFGLSEPRAGQRLKDVYVRTFQVPRTRGGVDFETVLRGRFDAKSAERCSDIHTQMSTSLSSALGMVRGSRKTRGGGSAPSVQAPAAQQQRVRLYEEPPVLPVRADKVLEGLKEVHKASRDLGDESVGVGPIHERTRDIFKQLADATLFAAAAESAARRTLPFVADTGTGKSHIIDNVLRSSECPNGEYRHDIEVQNLESVRFIRDVPVDQLAGGAGGDAGPGEMEEGGGEDEAAENAAAEKKWLQEHHLQLSEAETLRFLTSKFKKGVAEARKPDEIERMHSQAIRDFADPEKSLRMAYTAFSISFLLPVGSEVGSTTLVSIAIRNSKLYQVVLEFDTLQDMRVKRWGPEAKKKQPNSDVVNELRYAMGWSGVRTDKSWDAEARRFLKDSLPGQEPSLELMPELASVLGKKVAISGRGLNRDVDRSLMRRIVHAAQGIPDNSLGERVSAETGDVRLRETGDGGHAGASEGGRAGGGQPRSVFQIFCSFDHAEQLRVGKATSPALKRITVEPKPETLSSRSQVPET